MEKATQLFNAIAAFFIMMTGGYIHLTFEALLSTELLTLIWMLVATVIALQFTLGVVAVRNKIS